MNRFNFIDRRGDDYTFLQYSSNEIRITKKDKNNDLFHQIVFSAEAIENLQKFLDSIKEQKGED